MGKAAVKKKKVLRKRKDVWRARFLKALSERPSVTNACKVAKVARSVAYEERDKDPKFNEAWVAAKRSGLEAALDEAWDRGFTESDSLLKWMISRNIEGYADELKLSGSLDLTKLSDDDLRKRLQDALRRLDGESAGAS
jgi:hypothetical protein